MDIFLSWSGSRSRELALFLREWLRDVVQAVRPFMSEVDIEKGTAWFAAIRSAASKPSFCLLCITPENREAPWILFEGGLAASSLGDARVVPLVLGMTKASVGGPLGHLNAADVSDQADMLRLLTGINAKLETQLPPDKLRGYFDRDWPAAEDA